MKERVFITNGYSVKTTPKEAFEGNKILYRGWRLATADEILAAGYKEAEKPVKKTEQEVKVKVKVKEAQADDKKE